MSSTNTTSTRRCPVCDAPNSNLSVFCAECGASMNAPDSDDTAAYKPISSGSGNETQDTAAFEPGPFVEEPNNSTRVAAESPPGKYGSMWQASNASSSTSTSPPVPAPVADWSPADVTLQPHREATTPGIRGFVLGMIAALLILAVFLLWTWATLLDQGTRNSIQDFFGFIG